MQIFEKLITVTKDDLDELNHVNNVRYVKWVNDVAKEHWLQNASEDICKEYFWVLLKHNIEYKNSALLNDIIKIKTYILKTEGAKSTRVVEMCHDKTDKLIAKSETIWCLMNSKTLHPTRIPEDISQLFS
ncbi:MAG: acyl-CoA thioesterase [Flavobacteriaceae bacterium]|nr:acyl-CoA thioesterase [Flavobacteriaceae bacterium]